MKYLIFGLGNIGIEFADTRHNIGFRVADNLAENLKSEFSIQRYASVSEARYRAKSIFIIKPSTYMNLSGKAIKYWINKEKVPLSNVLVIVDEIALPLGTIRINPKGGHGGHNGLESIIEKTQTQEFPRLRFGIGKEYEKGNQVDYVLGKWTEDEEKIIIPKISRAVEMIKSFIYVGLEKTMTGYNE